MVLIFFGLRVRFAAVNTVFLSVQPSETTTCS
jgi:hypothetical protein